MWSAGLKDRPWKCLIIMVWATREAPRGRFTDPEDSCSATTPSRLVMMLM